MVVTRTGAKAMEEALAAIQAKLQELDAKFLGLHLEHSAMNTRWQSESSSTDGFSSSSNFAVRSYFFLASMVLIRLDGSIVQNSISVFIILLMSTKFHLPPFIWNRKLFNGIVGTSRLMKSQNGLIFPNSFCNDLVLVLLMTSQGLSLNLAKLALWKNIKLNLRNSLITLKDYLMTSIVVVLSVI